MNRAGSSATGYRLSKLLLSLLSLSWSCATPAQAPVDSTAPVLTLEGPFLFFTTDKLGQIYGVTPANDVIKYDAEGRELFRYNNNTLGRLAYLDPTNPFTVLCFYPDFQTVLLLDRTLNLRATLNLPSLDVLDVRAIALANDNFIWVYDEAGFRLKRLSAAGEVTFTSDDLSLLLGEAPRPDRLLAGRNRLFLIDPSLGVLIFDNFGRYETTLPITGLTSVQLWDDLLLYSRDGQWFRYDLDRLRETALPAPFPGGSLARWAPGRVLVMEDGRIRGWPLLK